MGYPSGLWVLDRDAAPSSAWAEKPSYAPYVKGSVQAESALQNGEEVAQNATKFSAIKAPVFSFQKLGKVEPSLGPEMKSTGEILGVDFTYEGALYKALVASGIHFKGDGAVCITVKPDDKPEALLIAQELVANGRELVATPGTAAFFRESGVPCESVEKIQHGSPNLLDWIMEGRISLMINTPSLTETAESEAARIRRACIETGVPCVTSLDTAGALVRALRVYQDPSAAQCRRLEEYLA